MLKFHSVFYVDYWYSQKSRIVELAEVDTILHLKNTIKIHKNLIITSNLEIVKSYTLGVLLIMLTVV